MEQGDAQTKRFLFMYYGKKFDTMFFHGKFGVSSVEGTIDDRGCHYVFVNTAIRIRTSQLSGAINEYNLCVPSTRVMRLQEDPYQPSIITMSSKKMEGSIYSKIDQDKQTKCQGGKSNYWFWNPDMDNMQAEHETLLQDSDSQDCDEWTSYQSRGNKRTASEDTAQSKKMKLTLGDGNPGSVVDEIINKEQDIEHHLVSELKQLQQEAEDLKSKLATSKDETASYKKSAEFYETQYNDYKDQMEDAGVVGSTEYYKTKAEDLEKKFNGLDGSEVEKFKELNTNYNRELEFAEQREGEIFDLKAKVLIGFILVHTLELTTPFRWGG
jgi:hypothetical protein